MIDPNVPQAEREQYIRDNAVSVVNEQAELIDRLREQIAKLEKSRTSIRLHLKRLGQRGAVKAGHVKKAGRP